MDMGIGQCVQVAPFWRSQTLAGTNLDLCLLMNWEQQRSRSRDQGSVIPQI